MQNSLAVLVATALVAGACATSVQAQEPPAHVMVTPDQLKWTSVPSLPAGAQLAIIEGPMDQAKPFTFRLKLPANYKIPPHWHSAIEHVTVISGTFYMGMGDTLDEAKMKALPAGSAAIMQPRTRHSAMTKAETEVQVHGVGPWSITYVNPADDPRKK